MDEKVEAMRKELVAQVIEDMASKGPAWVQEWSFDAPMNAKTQASYTGRNALVLSYFMRRDGLEDPRFMTFVQAKEAGHTVRKGSRSYPIERWRRIAMDAEDPKRRVRQPRTPEEWAAAEADPAIRCGYFCVGHYNLFNARDVDGLAPYQPIRNPVRESELVDFLEANSPCPVREVAGDAAFYSPAHDRIELPLRSQFSSEVALARVLLHEQGHATGAASRLGRDLSGRMGSKDEASRSAYAREELVAELTSLLAANELGVRLPAVGRDDEFARSEYWQNHVAYLKGWSCGLEDPAGELLRAASKAGKATTWLMEECFSPALDARMQGGAPEREAERGVSLDEAREEGTVRESEPPEEAAVEPHCEADAFRYAVRADGTLAQRGAGGHEATLSRVLAVPARDGGAVSWYVGDDEEVAMLHERADGSVALVSDMDAFAGNSFVETVEEVARGEETAAFMAPFVAEEVSNLREELGIPDPPEAAAEAHPPAHEPMVGRDGQSSMRLMA